MIRLYALRCTSWACARPWSATLAALRRGHGEACPFCGCESEHVDVARERAMRDRLRRMPPQHVRARATRAEFVERILAEYMPEALR